VVQSLCGLDHQSGPPHLHAAVLGQPAMPRRLSDLQVTAHLAEILSGPEELVALGQLADDLIRRMPPRLFDAMSLSILPRPNTGQQSPITTGPLRRAHRRRSSAAARLRGPSHI
jgi:hypothetical protein